MEAYILPKILLFKEIISDWSGAKTPWKRLISCGPQYYQRNTYTDNRATWCHRINQATSLSKSTEKETTLQLAFRPFPAVCVKKHDFPVQASQIPWEPATDIEKTKKTPKCLFTKAGHADHMWFYNREVIEMLYRIFSWYFRR